MKRLITALAAIGGLASQALAEDTSAAPRWSPATCRSMNGPETVSKLRVLCGTLLAARRLGEINVVLFECSVHNGRPHLEHEVCSSR
jgi:hypothetical protein